MSVSNMHNFLPKHDPSKSSPTPSRSLVKRKRGHSNEVPEGGEDTHAIQAQSRKSNKPVTMAVTHSKSPRVSQAAISTSHQPSEGLPTPLLSPTDSKMEDPQPLALQNDIDAQKGSAARNQRIRHVVQQQINLEILLKHNELRLIDQELAKCQTALEQLRRCKEIPYPAMRMSESVSNGSGSALRSSFSHKLPLSPAPWGVTDGPYARHYSQWLLPDSRFDGGESESQSAVSSKRPMKSRSVRASLGDESPVGMQSRSQRSGKLKALPAGYGQPKEKAQGPLVLKRKSDGMMVKLICPVCSRGDFGSAQGFINHCRIGHSRNFSSHDQAAEQCGEPVKVDEHGAVVGQELVSTSSASNVHPLIRTARLNQFNSPPAPVPRFPQLDGAMETALAPRPTISSDFRGSNQAPHLSDLVKSKGLGLNLEELVTEARLKWELPESDDEDMEEDEKIPAPEGANPHHTRIGGTRGVTRPVKSPATSPLLQSRLPARSSFSGSQADPATLRGDEGEDLNVVQEQNEGPEPSPTNESNQAPSLIDDDEDYEVHSPTSTSTSEDADEGEVNFAVRDDDDFNHVELPQPESQPSCTQGSTAQSPQPPRARARQPSAFRSQTENHKEKHVTFVNENPGQLKTSGDRKRRRTAKG